MFNSHVRIWILAPLVLAGVGVITGCGHVEEGATAAAGGPAQAAETVQTTAPVLSNSPPQLVFDSSIHDFGRMLETETRTARMTFANAGGERLLISEVRTTCGCTAVRLERKEYLPGERGHIDITFDPTGPGEQRKFVNVFSNADPDGFARLIIEADVQAFIIVEPREVELGIRRYRQEHRAVVQVSSPDPNFAVDAITTTNEHVTAREVQVDATTGKHMIEITVHPSAAWGRLFSWLDISGRGQPSPESAPMTHRSRIRVQGQLFGELYADPDTFRFGVKPGEAFERTIRLNRPGGGAFQILLAEVISGGLDQASVRIDPIAENDYSLTLIATGARRPMEHMGAVAVETTVPGEEHIEIPIAGVTRTQAKSVK